MYIISYPGKIERLANLNCIIPAHQELTKEEHQKFYGGDERVPLHGTKWDRLVFEYIDTKMFTVIPDTPTNRDFFRKV